MFVGWMRVQYFVMCLCYFKQFLIKEEGMGCQSLFDG